MSELHNLESIKHYVCELPWGGEILVLNDSPLITAEDRAMLQALHSRDPKGIRSHLTKLAKNGSGKLMSTYYVGYGHKSIGDCAVATVFVEGVSMLAAKALQDHALYNGQECSTRYIDFSTQPFYNPLTNTLEDTPVTTKLREFYIKNLPLLKAHLKMQNPIKSEEDEKVYEKAISARAFDIMRGFLPCGASTNLAWTTTLRQFADRLIILRNHPLEELRVISENIEKLLIEAYPNSFGHKRYEATENYTIETMSNYYFESSSITEEVKIQHDGIDRILLEDFRKYFDSRPPKTELPKYLAVLGESRIEFMLDFASFRDIQRHRSLNMRMPLVTTNHGFESWYLENLPSNIRNEAVIMLQEIEKSFSTIEGLILQYYIPMGYLVPIQFSADLPSLLYVCEIRSTEHVHPTLRKKAIALSKLLSNNYKIKIHSSEAETDFSYARGKDDIEEKKNA